MNEERKPKTWTSEAFEVRPSNIPEAKLGLFAKTRILPGDTIGYYTGRVITEEEMETTRYADSSYILWVTKNHIIVGNGPQANYTRYINHSSRPNAFLVVSTRWKTARFEAILKISADDEIYFDYGEYYWNTLDVQPSEPPARND